MGVWEPLLEPLEDETGEGFRPWRLVLKVLVQTHTFNVHCMLICVFTVSIILCPDEKEGGELPKTV